MTTRRRPQLTYREQRAVEALKTRLLQAFNGGVARLLLFGSKARGDAHRGSDVDLLLVLRRKNRQSSDAIDDLVFDLLMQHHVHLSLMTLSEREFTRWSHPPTSFMYTVLQDGVSLL